MAAPTNRGISAPAQGAVAITPSDTTNLDYPIRQLTINVAGTVSFIAHNGTTYTTGTLPAGSYPVEAIRIMSTNTTATGITGWY